MISEDKARNDITVFESTVGSMQGKQESKVLKEEFKEGTDRSEVTAQFGEADPLILRYELVREEGEWYINVISWGDGKIVKGFDAPITTIKSNL
jgi:hypothetical protein